MSRSGLVEEAARIYCEEQLTDYRAAKQKAAQRLGLGSKAALPDNAQVQQAVIEYQALFGGAEYREHLTRLRKTAVRAMKLLGDFEPRLVGATVTGAVNGAHRVQLHASCDKPEMLEMFLQDCKIRYEQDERNYRYARGDERSVTLVCFEADGIGVDVAVFNRDEKRAVPVNPADGRPYRRLDLAAAQALAAG